MDVEKVIKGLECCTKKLCIYKDTEKECPYSELCGDYEVAFEDCTTALSKDAIALLKAQEPVMVQKKPMEEIKTWDWVCGKCGGPVLYSAKYCSWCGQAVKWE